MERTDPNNVTQLNALFAQGARCGHLEAGGGCLYSPDDAARYVDAAGTRSWTAFEACESALCVRDATLAEKIAWSWGYERGFRLSKQGRPLPSEIECAAMPEVF